jgi:hypothetical protein
VSLHARNRAKPKVRGFGHSPEQEAQHFVVVVPKAQAADVMIYEVYQEDAHGPQLDGANLRCILNRAKWLKIVDAVEEEHNKRLRAAGMKAASFKAGETPVARLLGKELVLLAWAIEDANASMAPAAIENWRGLSPEERWWLYTMTAAQTGHHGKRNIGWRKAVRYALTENPVVATTGVTTAEHKQRTKGAAKQGGQGKLFGFEETAFEPVVGNGIWGEVHEELPEVAEALPQLEHVVPALALEKPSAPSPSKKRKKKVAKQEDQGRLFGFDEAPSEAAESNVIRGEPCEQLPQPKRPKAQPRATKTAKASSRASSRSPSSPRSATKSERRMQARR